jgi:DNA-binding SARP family transcriptional activator
MADVSLLQGSLKIYLLGRFCVEVDDVAIKEQQWELRSAKLLIKLLAIKPAHRLHREQIIDTLWTEQDPEHAINKLNKAIHSARRTLEPRIKRGNESRFILSQKQQITLHSPTGLYIDTDEFERLAAVAIKNADVEAGEAAIELYQGDLLTEDIYEEWLSVKRESLRLLYRKVAAKTASIHAENKDYQKSIEIFKRLAFDDPSDEHVQQRLMRLLAITGSKYQSLKQFELCSSALRELGVEPDPETIELVENIKSGKIVRQEAKSTRDAATAAASPSNQSLGLPAVRQLTFQQGGIQAARFASRGENIVYSAAWNGGDYEVYKIHQPGTDSIDTGLNETGLFAVSPGDEIALAQERKFLRGYTSIATLAIQHLTGGMPRPLLENVQWADWSPNKDCLSVASEKECLAVVRDADGKNRLEYPIGNMLYETGGWISHPQFSPDGKWIAFVDHESLAEDSGTVSVINLNGENRGKKQVLTDVWISLQGLVWNKQSQEIWFTAAKEGNARKIYAVNLSGNERLIYQGIGCLTLHDLSEDNKALITVEKDAHSYLRKVRGRRSRARSFMARLVACQGSFGGW